MGDTHLVLNTHFYILMCLSVNVCRNWKKKRLGQVGDLFMVSASLSILSFSKTQRFLKGNSLLPSFYTEESSYISLLCWAVCRVVHTPKPWLQPLVRPNDVWSNGVLFPLVGQVSIAAMCVGCHHHSPSAPVFLQLHFRASGDWDSRVVWGFHSLGDMIIKSTALL